VNALLEARSLRKSYGATVAVDSLSHSFPEGKITAIVGPSGSGKTTTLWMIAGLTEPSGGSVRLDGRDITALPAHRREIGIVFQDYALFPHLNVRENVEFGLRCRHVRRAERRRRAAETLALVRMEHLAERRVQQLSGGERQRVALARAIAFRPRVLLLDEPLSSLDARLREELRGELFRLLRELAITTVYVTHDQVEAMSIGHELAVMSSGRIEQSGPPAEVYRRPENLFVAGFLGSANIFPADCAVRNGRLDLALPFAAVDAPAGASVGPCWAMIRPEDLEVVCDDGADFQAAVESSLFLGNQLRLLLRAGGSRIIVDARNDLPLTEGAILGIGIRAGKVVLWPREDAGASPKGHERDGAGPGPSEMPRGSGNPDAPAPQESLEGARSR